MTQNSRFIKTQKMMEETLTLFTFSRPDANCDCTGNGWADLQPHTRTVHARLMREGQGRHV
ncbi:hypothetical protein AN958_10102 [Leucoagaricus sp. SymC.cos]|nr:hypothetical protein AN958_10102 [Leucoagaricus sp. SymC.cos]